MALGCCERRLLGGLLIRAHVHSPACVQGAVMQTGCQSVLWGPTIDASSRGASTQNQAAIAQTAIAPTIRTAVQRYDSWRGELIFCAVPAESFTVMLMRSSIRMTPRNDICGVDFGEAVQTRSSRGSAVGLRPVRPLKPSGASTAVLLLFRCSSAARYRERRCWPRRQISAESKRKILRKEASLSSSGAKKSRASNLPGRNQL